MRNISTFNLKPDDITALIQINVLTERIKISLYIIDYQYIMEENIRLGLKT
jgi:hypothetical protein